MVLAPKSQLRNAKKGSNIIDHYTRRSSPNLWPPWTAILGPYPFRSPSEYCTCTAESCVCGSWEIRLQKSGRVVAKRRSTTCDTRDPSLNFGIVADKYIFNRSHRAISNCTWIIKKLSSGPAAPPGLDRPDPSKTTWTLGSSWNLAEMPLDMKN